MSYPVFLLSPTLILLLRLAGHLPSLSGFTTTVSCFHHGNPGLNDDAFPWVYVLKNERMSLDQKNRVAEDGNE
jgi:hypothetical protein